LYRYAFGVEAEVVEAVSLILVMSLVLAVVVAVEALEQVRDF
jgi:hypothetical protein